MNLEIEVDYESQVKGSKRDGSIFAFCIRI